MKSTIGVLLIFVLVSCQKKVENENAKLSKNSIEIIKLEKIPHLDNSLFGEWMMQLSCDGSIVCNMCARVLFKENGTGMTTVNGKWLLDNFKWEIVNNKVKVFNTYRSLIDNGEYAFTYKKDGDNIKLRLIDALNDNCYLLIGTSSNAPDNNSISDMTTKDKFLLPSFSSITE